MKTLYPSHQSLLVISRNFLVNFSSVFQEINQKFPKVPRRIFSYLSNYVSGIISKKKFRISSANILETLQSVFRKLCHKILGRVLANFLVNSTFVLRYYFKNLLEGPWQTFT